MYSNFKLKDLEKKYTFNPRKINRDGYSSDCFDIGESLIGKTHKQGTFDYYRLVREFVKLKRAYDLGLKVPKPEGIYLVENIEEGTFTPMLVMEKLEGTVIREYHQIDEGRFERALRKGNKEKIKAIKMGFDPIDSSCVNMMWNQAEGEAYLFDLDDWLYRDKQRVRNLSKQKTQPLNLLCTA